MKNSTKESIIEQIIPNAIAAIVVFLICLWINYVTLPAWNVSSVGMWILIAGGITAFTVISYMIENILCEESTIFHKICVALSVLSFAFVAIAAIGSSAMFNAITYSQIAEDKKTVTSIDVIEEMNFDNLITVDRENAKLIGNRKMGTMTDLVSQYVVSELYTQINYKNAAYRVSPLEHASIFKWSDNKTIPGYILVNVTDGTAEFVEYEIKYSTSNFFGTNVTRIVRNRYPSLLIDSHPAFEIDEEGNPYWVYCVEKKTVGLFGGKDSDGILLVNASTGKMERYAQDDIPQWVDHAVNGDLMIEQLNWNGAFKNGFWNSLFTQTNCTSTTRGYGYILGNDDIYLYTGITSMVTDESNIGFTLVNMRTSEIQYIEYPSAEEYSAMSTAEGKIQEKGYKATFPVLMKKDGKLWYFLALKDSAGLVKAYSFVDASDYTKVSVEEDITTAWNKISMTEEIVITDPSDIEMKSAVIENIQSVVVDGNTIYYIMFENDDNIYTARIAVSKRLPFIKTGDKIEYSANSLNMIQIIN